MALTIAGSVGAEKASFQGQGATSVLKQSDGGRLVKIDGSFSVKYKDYTANGSLGEFSQPPEGNKNATTRLRVVITKDAKLTSTGNDPFELTAAKLIDMDLDSESIIAKGEVRITAKKATITADQMDGGQATAMRPVIEKAASNLGAQYAALVTEWLSHADAKDRLLLLEGNVKATDVDFSYTGGRLVVNTTKEIYLFLGPHQLEINIKDESPADINAS